jgi:rhodanese-related sulfurtransferase
MGFLTQFFNRPAINQVDPADVQAMIEQTPRPYLLDVRTPVEYKEAHVRGAELIPLNELAAKTGRLPKGREIVCICASGSRSNAAARQLVARGFKASNMKGGMSRWIRAGLPVKSGMAK